MAASKRGRVPDRPCSASPPELDAARRSMPHRRHRGDRIVRRSRRRDRGIRRKPVPGDAARGTARPARSSRRRSAGPSAIAKRRGKLHAAPAPPPGRAAAGPAAPGALRPECVPQASFPALGRGFAQRLDSCRRGLAGSVRPSGTALLFFLLPRFSGQLLLFSRLVIVRFRH
jgi:hypothetical protein